MSTQLSRRRLLMLPCLAASGGLGATGSEILIGASAALSGPSAALGTRFHVGARACFAQLNRQGGAQGRSVRLLLLDDGYEPDRAEANTRRLVDNPQVLALFGYVGTPTSKAALPFVKRAHIPFVGAFTGADVLRDPALETVFNLRAGYKEEAALLARSMQQAGVQQFSALMQADLFGRVGMEAMREAAAAVGIRMRASAMVKRNSDDVTQALGTLVRADAAEAIFMATSYVSSAAFVLRARKAGYRGRFYSLSFTGLEPLIDALGPRFGGVSVAQVVPDPRDASIPVVAAYQAALREIGELHSDTLSLEGYLAARLLFEGLRRMAEPFSRARLNEALSKLGLLDFGGFVIDYREGGGRQGSHYVGLRTLD